MDISDAGLVESLCLEPMVDMPRPEVKGATRTEFSHTNYHSPVQPSMILSALAHVRARGRLGGHSS